MDLGDLRAMARRLPPHERSRFQRRLTGAARIDDPTRRARVLEMVSGELEGAVRRLERRRTLSPGTISYPEELPITARRADLLAAIRDHQVVVVAGETGSGKSTQLPKLCLELGRGVSGLIGHTQPRRIAARSIAERVAEELGGAVGGLVGYTVRFTDQVGDDTLVKVMTDGILLAEIHHDRLLGRYDTIILDEAHERSLNIDFLLGYLTTLLPRRPDLKVVITSATIDTERFAGHFGGAPVVEVSGRTYPVEIRYRPLDDPSSPEPRDQPDAICDAITELVAEPLGDVLVFCSGEREIRDAADAITDLRLRHTEILPLYARLSAAEQHRVFQAHTGRRIVLATNVAETSLTVPGIRYVVDPGTARISRFSRRTKVQRLPIEPVSQASADQRAGRCGRLGPGICIRLYSEDDFLGRPEFTEPEILRTNLASVILQMGALELGEVDAFPFLDPPDSRAIRDGVALLHELGAVDPHRYGTPRWLTAVGRRLARLPLDPRIGRMVLAADDFGCLREILVIAAALTIQDPRERPADQQAQADQAHARFRDERSDFLSWLNLWEYIRDERRERTSSRFRAMCREEFLNYRRVREWQDLVSQLREITDELGMTPNREPAGDEQIHRALLTGLLSHVGRKDPDGFEYRGARGARFSIAPGSTLFKRAPEWVMAAELVETTRLWARGIAEVPVAWIEELGAHLLTRSHGVPRWDRERGSVVATETTTLFGIPLVADRTVQYGRIDPAAARRLFIRHALVGGEWETHHAFEARNRAAIAEVAATEERERRTDLLVDEDTLVEWFAARVPDGVASVRDFDRWWRDAGSEHPGLLELSPADLIDPAADPPDDEAFPEVWRHGDLAFDLEYRFDPAAPHDGVTVDVPIADLARADPDVFAWNVPGRRAELIEALVRSLPKRLRKQFVPIADTVAAVQAAIGVATGNPLHAVRRELSRISGATIVPDDFDMGAVPGHLRPRFRVIGDGGSVVAAGDDLAALKGELAAGARATITAARHPLERDGLTTWDIGDLPRMVEVGDGAHRARAYPALVDEGDAVAVRLLATPEEQEAAMRGGVRRLVLVSLPSPSRILQPMITDAARRAIGYGPHDSVADWVDDCLMASVGVVVDHFGGPPWTADGFAGLRSLARDRLADVATEAGAGSIALLETLGSVQVLLPTVVDRFPEVADDVVEQVNRMVYPGFLSGVGAGRIPDIHRYLRAVEHRLRKLPERPGRDAELMVRVRRLESEWERLASMFPASPGLIDAAWMIEELRVSLFAQPLGTAVKVSERRIAAALEAVAR